MPTGVRGRRLAHERDGNWHRIGSDGLREEGNTRRRPDNVGCHLTSASASRKGLRPRRATCVGRGCAPRFVRGRYPRAANVVEGLKGYWQAPGQFAIRTMRRHFERMCRSAKLLHMPVDFSCDEFVEACSALARAQLREGSDLYIRANVFAIEGHYGEGTVTDLVLVAYQQDQTPSPPVDVGTSTWLGARISRCRHASKVARTTSLPASLASRVRSRGYGDMILLNQSGRVAEGIAACFVMVRDGKIFTPPAYEGALESITLDIVEDSHESKASTSYAGRSSARSFISPTSSGSSERMRRLRRFGRSTTWLSKGKDRFSGCSRASIERIVTGRRKVPTAELTPVSIKREPDPHGADSPPRQNAASSQ